MREAVCIYVSDPRGKILTVTNRRSGGFSLPGGKVESDETRSAAALRELKEETGLEPVALRYLGALPHLSSKGEDFLCHAFEAICVGEPFESEPGTVPFWKEPEALLTEDANYPTWDRAAFEKFDFVLTPFNRVSGVLE